MPSGPTGYRWACGHWRRSIHPKAGLRRYSQKGGHYFFVVKDNQPTLRQDIADLWELAPAPPAHVSKINKHGGRVEQRSLWVSDALVGYSDWPYMAQVCRIRTGSHPQGKDPSGCRLRGYQSLFPGGRASTAAEPVAWALGHRKPRPLGEGCNLR